MKKPLQEQKEQNLIWSKGRLIGWGTNDVKNLIANANRAKVENLMAKQQVTVRDEECILTYQWFETLLKNGLTKEVIKKLNSRLERVFYHHVLMISPDGPPFWRRVANGDQIHDPEIGVAYGIAHLLAMGGFDRLKRCRMETCQKFFMGRPNASWCSEACGSKHRVTKKRKKDRLRM